MKAAHTRILAALATAAVAFSALAWKQEDVDAFSRLMKEGQELAKAGKYEEAIAKGKAAMKVNFVRVRAADFVTGCYAKLALHGTDKMLPMRWLDECWEKRAEYLLDDAAMATLMSDYGWRAFCMFRPDLVREAKRRMDSIGVKPDVYRHFDLAEEGIRLYDDLASFPRKEEEIGFGKTLADFGVADTNTVHAKDFGWNATNATAAIQKAIDTGATTVVIDAMPSPWYVTTVWPRSNQRILFRKGVRMLGVLDVPKYNDFVMFHLKNVENVILEGEGAKDDAFLARYPDYETRKRLCKGEGESGVRFTSARNVVIRNLTLAQHSKDGISFGVTSHHVWVENVSMDGNYRQGCSVGSAYDVYFRFCDFVNTRGGSPMAGFDHEPPVESGFDANVYFFDCLFANNAGGGLIWASSTISPVTAYMKRCRFEGNGSNCIDIYSRPGSYMHPDAKAPSMLLFEDCTGVSPAARAAITFPACMLFDTVFRNCSFTEGERRKDRLGVKAAPVHFCLNRDFGEFNTNYHHMGSLRFENVAFTGWTNVTEAVKVLNEEGAVELYNLSGEVTLNGRAIDVSKYESHPIDRTLGKIAAVDPATLGAPEKQDRSVAGSTPKSRPWVFCPWYNPPPKHAAYWYDGAAWHREVPEKIWDWTPPAGATAFAFQADTEGCRWARTAPRRFADDCDYRGYFEVPAGGRPCIVKTKDPNVFILDPDGKRLEPYEGDDEFQTVKYWKIVPRSKAREIWSFYLPPKTHPLGKTIRFYPPLTGIWADDPGFLPAAK